jgi:hypothetical protein
MMPFTVLLKLLQTVGVTIVSRTAVPAAVAGAIWKVY